MQPLYMKVWRIRICCLGFRAWGKGLSKDSVLKIKGVKGLGFRVKAERHAEN